MYMPIYPAIRLSGTSDPEYGFAGENKIAVFDGILSRKE